MDELYAAYITSDKKSFDAFIGDRIRLNQCKYCLGRLGICDTTSELKLTERKYFKCEECKCSFHNECIDTSKLCRVCVFQGERNKSRMCDICCSSSRITDNTCAPKAMYTEVMRVING